MTCVNRTTQDSNFDLIGKSLSTYKDKQITVLGVILERYCFFLGSIS